MRSCFRVIAIGLMVVVSLPAWAQANFYLHQDDRVVFYGDSITEQGRYAAFVENYVLTRFPKLNVTFVNSGWSGEWIVGGGGGKVDLRLARDVIAEHPTVATFMLGMNDAAYQDYDPSFFEVYSKGYLHLVETIRQALPACRVVLFEPSPFDDITRGPQYALRDGGYNKVIVRYGQFVRELAQQQNLGAVDMNSPLLAVLEKAHLANPALAEKIIPDKIHPSSAGGAVMAAALLKSWNAPAIVSWVEIDAGHSRVQRQDNTQVTGLKNKPTLTWTQMDSALPMPFDPKDDVLALVLQSSDIVQSLDQQLLTVTGLSAAKYSLRIDGEDIGSWSREELRHGVNLALQLTPMLRQSLDVYAFSARRNAVRLARWQGIQVGLQNETSAHVMDALKALDAAGEDLLQQQRVAAAPTAHHYELVPQDAK